MNFPFINVVTSTTSNSNIRQTGSDTFDTARKKKKSATSELSTLRTLYAHKFVAKNHHLHMRLNLLPSGNFSDESIQ